MLIKPTNTFSKSLKKLYKKDKLLLQEYEQLLNDLKANPTLGTYIGNDTYKIRIKNRSNNKGKSAGYRVITYTKLEDMVLLVNIYSKSDTDNLKENIIDEIIKSFLDSKTD